MKQSSLKALVDELIEIEPSLKKQRKALEKNVKALLSAKPDTKFTNTFKQKLLKDLQPVVAASATSAPSPYQAMQKFLYATLGAAVASIGLYVTVINPMVPMPMADDADGNTQPTSVAMQRNTVMKNQAMPADEMGYVEHSEDVMGMPMEEYEGGRAGGGGGYGMADSRMAISPYPYNVLQYSYDGEIALPEEDLTVYHRKPLKGSTKADLLTGTFVDEMMDVSALNSLSVTSVSLSEPGDEPLMINVDFTDGNIGIHRQIDYTRRPDNNCRDQACFDRYRLKERDMLTDQRAIEIATDFADDLKIDLTAYGTPRMQDDWRMRYETASPEMKSDFYFPENVTVVFPYMVNGKPVMDEWGGTHGVAITVDVRLRAATSLWGLRTMDYETETMDAVDDEAALHEFIQSGSNWGYEDPNATVLLGKLGDPEMVYISHYKWDEDDRLGYEIYVPALSFPITEMPPESYEHRKAVVVPLSKELIEERLSQMPPDMMPMPVEPYPMPMEELPISDPPTIEMEMMKEEMMQ